LKAAKAHGVKAIVYTSTPSVVHADEGIRGADESMPIATHFLAHYPKTKAIAEQEMLGASTDELPICALRPHLIWGPGDRHLIPRLVARAKQNRLKMIGPPSPMVDSCYIDDAARAHILAAQDLLSEGHSRGRAYFISQGEPWPIDQLTQGILSAVNVDWKPSYVSRTLAMIVGVLCEAWYRVFRLSSEPPMTRFIASQLSTDHWYDISAAQRDFGFEPSRSVDGCLKELREYTDTD
ncbi:MAG: NAD-dependent epimerase/dehydratase family protein, partial [Bradymonadia bacterium]